ncbi:rhodanese-like domain-containing protein [Pseudodesulfovibrio sp.]|nr:rhodanese-like domain-containing protein [Pseudodesulfovibrio sp.]
MKKLTLAALFVMLVPVLAWATDYNYISQNDMRSQLDTKAQVTIVDICPIDQFAKGHLPGSIETNAYPVKTDDERAKLDAILPQLQASNDNIVIVCPGGKGGAKRTYEYYKAQGINEKRLLILESGMNGWPYQTEAN